MPLMRDFPVPSTSAIAAAAAAGDPVVTLNATTGLSVGQNCCSVLGATAGPCGYAPGRGGDQVTLAAGLLNGKAIGDPVFPDTFATPPPVALALRRGVHRRPRVVRDTAANVSTPVVNASVTVTDFWRTRLDSRTPERLDDRSGPALRQFAVPNPSGVSRRARRDRGRNAGLAVAADDRRMAAPADCNQLSPQRRAAPDPPPSPAPLPNRLLLSTPDDPQAPRSTPSHNRASGSPAEPATLTLELPLVERTRRMPRRPSGPGALPPPTLTLAAARNAATDVCSSTLRRRPSGRCESPAGLSTSFTLAPLSVRTDATATFGCRRCIGWRASRSRSTTGQRAGADRLDPDYGEAEQWVDAVYPVMTELVERNGGSEMPEYLAPDVYVEEIDTGSKPIEGVSTSTAGMLGVTERGPANVPILVTSYGEFARWFGGRARPADVRQSGHPAGSPLLPSACGRGVLHQRRQAGVRHARRSARRACVRSSSCTIAAARPRRRRGCCGPLRSCPERGAADALYVTNVNSHRARHRRARRR